MDEWRLYDETGPLEDFNDNFPFIVIESEEQLRIELEFWRHQEPSAICLASHDDQRLNIGIGGPYCGIRWIKPPFRESLKMPIADPKIVEEGIEFKQEGKRDGLAFR